MSQIISQRFSFRRIFFHSPHPLLSSLRESAPHASAVAGEKKARTDSQYIRLIFGFAVFGFAGLGLLSPSAFAQGCAMCQTVLPQADEPIARGMFWCVMILLTAPFAVCATVGGWLVYHYRQLPSGHLQKREEG